MKRTSLAAIALAVLVLGAGCRTEETTPPLPTALPPAPTGSTGGVIATEPATETVVTVTAAPTEAPPTEALPTETLPTAPPTPEATATMVTPTPDLSPTPAPTETPWPTLTPDPNTSVFAPGQVDTATLAEGGSRAYLIDGVQFQPQVLFVEPVRELDVALASYAGDQTGQLPEGGAPLSSADNALAGRPEVLVLSPESSGTYTFVVRATSGAGEFTAHLYSPTAAALGMAVQQPDTLGAGETKSYSVTSRGARPVLVMVDPTDLSDVAIDILDANGGLLTTSNFGGAGGIETAYVLPMGTTSYTVNVREANGQPSSYNVAIVTMD